MEYLKLFVFLICVALMLHVTAASKSSKRSKSKESKKSSKKDCGGPPPTPANGVVTGSNYLPGDVVTYKCDTGYVLESISTCQSSGIWDNLDSTTCRADCGPPTPPDNGVVTGSNYLQGDVVTYSCNDGYELEGQSTSTCQSNKTWDNTDSICIAVCSSVLQASTDPKTFVSHDGYGISNYASSMDSCWLIEAREGYTIDFSIKAIEIENNGHPFGNDTCFDFVEVFDGRTETNTKLGGGKYCGSTVPGAISSTGRYMLVHFRTDSSVGYSGFLAEYEEGGPITN